MAKHTISERPRWKNSKNMALKSMKKFSKKCLTCVLISILFWNNHIIHIKCEIPVVKLHGSIFKPIHFKKNFKRVYLLDNVSGLSASYPYTVLFKKISSNNNKQLKEFDIFMKPAWKQWKKN